MYIALPQAKVILFYIPKILSDTQGTEKINGFSGKAQFGKLIRLIQIT